jgi:hypothetical protein
MHPVRSISDIWKQDGCWIQNTRYGYGRSFVPLMSIWYVGGWTASPLRGKTKSGSSIVVPLNRTMNVPKLSTMVVLTTTNLHLQTNRLLEELPINDWLIKIEKRGVARRGASARDSIRRRAKPTPTSSTGFGHNSITVVVLNDGDGALPTKEITMKLFQNGVVHMTGVLDDRYDQSALRTLMNCIWDHHRDCITYPPEHWEVLRRRVVLMNYTTELVPLRMVPRESFFRAIQALHDPTVVASYDPDVYPGVKIQFLPEKWTAKVFRTGKMILTGLTSHTECQSCVDRCTQLLTLTLP